MDFRNGFYGMLVKLVVDGRMMVVGSFKDFLDLYVIFLVVEVVSMNRLYCITL